MKARESPILISSKGYRYQWIPTDNTVCGKRLNVIDILEDSMLKGNVIKKIENEKNVVAESTSFNFAKGILSKVDGIQLQLDSINSRLNHIETAVKSSQIAINGDLIAFLKEIKKLIPAASAPIFNPPPPSAPISNSGGFRLYEKLKEASKVFVWTPENVAELRRDIIDMSLKDLEKIDWEELFDEDGEAIKKVALNFKATLVSNVVSNDVINELIPLTSDKSKEQAETIISAWEEGNTSLDKLCKVKGNDGVFPPVSKTKIIRILEGA